MRRLALAAALVLATGCESTPETTDVVLVAGAHSTTLSVEVADTAEERARGLSGRDEVAPDSGMLFRFDGLTTGRFWMKNTRVSLSIAFLDGGGRVLAVRDMTPCRREPCPLYGAGRPYRTALEVRRGVFDRLGFGAGDRVRVPPSPD